MRSYSKRTIASAIGNMALSISQGRTNAVATGKLNKLVYLRCQRNLSRAKDIICTIYLYLASYSACLCTASFHFENTPRVNINHLEQKSDNIEDKDIQEISKNHDLFETFDTHRSNIQFKPVHPRRVQQELYLRNHKTQIDTNFSTNSTSQDSSSIPVFVPISQFILEIKHMEERLGPKNMKVLLGLLDQYLVKNLQTELLSRYPFVEEIKFSSFAVYQSQKLDPIFKGKTNLTLRFGKAAIFTLPALLPLGTVDDFGNNYVTTAVPPSSVVDMLLRNLWEKKPVLIERLRFNLMFVMPNEFWDCWWIEPRLSVNLELPTTTQYDPRYEVLEIPRALPASLANIYTIGVLSLLVLVSLFFLLQFSKAVRPSRKFQSSVSQSLQQIDYDSDINVDEECGGNKVQRSLSTVDGLHIVENFDSTEDKKDAKTADSSLNPAIEVQLQKSIKTLDNEYNGGEEKMLKFGREKLAPAKIDEQALRSKSAEQVLLKITLRDNAKNKKDTVKDKHISCQSIDDENRSDGGSLNSKDKDSPKRVKFIYSPSARSVLSKNDDLSSIRIFSLDQGASAVSEYNLADDLTSNDESDISSIAINRRYPSKFREKYKPVKSDTFYEHFFSKGDSDSSSQESNTHSPQHMYNAEFDTLSMEELFDSSDTFSSDLVLSEVLLSPKRGENGLRQKENICINKTNNGLGSKIVSSDKNSIKLKKSGSINLKQASSNRKAKHNKVTDSSDDFSTMTFSDRNRMCIRPAAPPNEIDSQSLKSEESSTYSVTTCYGPPCKATKKSNNVVSKSASGIISSEKNGACSHSSTGFVKNINRVQNESNVLATIPRAKRTGTKKSREL